MIEIKYLNDVIGLVLTQDVDFGDGNNDVFK